MSTNFARLWARTEATVMATDAKIITLELQAIAGALTVASNALVKVQGQQPPGPPIEPAQIAALNSITASAGSITATAAAILAGGAPPNG
jgi:hypothetical protein